MKLENIINSKYPILITGETGTGKTFMAKDIHRKSKRTIFKQLNVAGLNDALVESELFGHEKGAFSGAICCKKGFFESVENGTLFLDEIGELSLTTQAKLLTVLDEGLFYRVGSTSAKKFSGRFIYATHKNLELEVANGRFREDLFYRLRYFEFKQQPLRLKTNILGVILTASQEKGLKHGYQLIFSSEVFSIFENYKWPGNLRELAQTLDYLYCLNKKMITIDDLPYWLRNENCKTNSSNDYYEALESFEYNYLKKCMIRNSGAINKTAIEIGLSKVTLISKLKKYDIDRRLYKNKPKEEKVYGL